VDIYPIHHIYKHLEFVVNNTKEREYI